MLVAGVRWGGEPGTGATCAPACGRVGHPLHTEALRYSSFWTLRSRCAPASRPLRTAHRTDNTATVKRNQQQTCWTHMLKSLRLRAVDFFCPVPRTTRLGKGQLAKPDDVFVLKYADEKNCRHYSRRAPASAHAGARLLQAVLNKILLETLHSKITIFVPDLTGATFIHLLLDQTFQKTEDTIFIDSTNILIKSHNAFNEFHKNQIDITFVGE